MPKTFASWAILLSLLAGGSPLAAAEEGASDPLFVPMDEFIVPIVGSERIDGSLRFTLVLDAKDEAGQAQLTTTLPRLRATIVAAAIEFSRLYASERMPVDVARLTDDLADALRHDNAGITRVLIVQVSAVAA